VRRFVQILFFLVWVNEKNSVYAEHGMWSPFQWVEDWLILPVAKVRPIDALLLLVLVYAVAKGAFKVATVRPVKRTLLGALGVTLLALVYGLATGGDARAALWQSYLPMSMILAAFTIAATHHTAEHFVGLLKAFVAAGLVHVVSCIFFHFLYIKPGLINPLPEAEALHHDSVIWSASVGLLILLALRFPSSRNRLLAGVLVPLLLMAIQFNRRRLAFVSLIADMLVLYFVRPASRVKRTVQRIALGVIPVVLLYVVIGWGRPESIFRPLQSFQTVSVDQDKSTKARNVENLGLIATANKYGWVMGSGWGQKYVEVSSLYNIYFFELWPYVPHNSVLGLFAYTGYVGFVGFWMLFPMSAFFNARVARQAKRPIDQYISTVALMQIASCADQWYGDMGSFSLVTMYTLSSTLAVALRLPLATGVWSNGGVARRIAPAAPPTVAG
jgi:hypothetical protein